MKTLVISEHDNRQVSPATLKTISAARAIGGDIEVLVAGADCLAAAEAVRRIGGVTKVLVCDASQYAGLLAENLAALVGTLASGYTHILAPATAFGKNVLPRLSAILDVAQVSEITAVVSQDTFERPIYAGNAIAVVQALDPIKLVTVRVAAFDAAEPTDVAAPVESLSPEEDLGLSSLVGRKLTVSERPSLAAARLVVSGGRGLGSGESFQRLLEPLADTIGAALGASRAAVDAGYVPNDFQVGQTGKIVAPELYLAVGISGAIQHLAGMKDAKVIVAINKDPDAPIFEVADYGLVGDLFAAVPELTEKLTA